MRLAAVRVYIEAAGGEWLPAGEARIEVAAGRKVLRLSLDAVPTSGRLCVSLADLDVLRADEVEVGHGNA